MLAPNNTLMWRGIPYAEPPMGENRWRIPKPAPKWAGTLNATQFRPNCAQLGPAWVSLHRAVTDCKNYMKGCVNWTWSNATSEDCLYINVHQSATPAPKPRPVIVYFAAGAFEWGAANDAENSGDSLGIKPGWDDVILVTLNYRKGIFGFLASDELRERDERNTSGVFGLQDQTMALAWVRDHIGSFGGDPSRVTLFGESAGATSVSMHMVMPDSAGLFHGAAIDSGAFNQWTYRPWSDGTDLYDTLVEQLGCKSWAKPYECMLSKPTEILLNISDTYYGNCSLPHKESLVTTQWAPVVDGVIITGIPVDTLSAGKALKVPVVLGSNKNEGSMFLNAFIRAEADFDQWASETWGETSGAKIAAHYKLGASPPAPPSPGHQPSFNGVYNGIAQDAAGDFVLRCPTVMAARHFERLGQPTYLYSFDHAPFESINWPRQSFHLGAFHGAEVPYVFYDSFELVGAERELSATMATFYTNFAATGNPNTKPNSTRLEVLTDDHQRSAPAGPRRLQHHYPPGWGPPPQPSEKCNGTSTHPGVMQWPRYSGEGSDHIVFDLCNVTTQTVYRTSHCEFWEQLCADPAANLSMACAFNRTGPFPHPP